MCHLLSNMMNQHSDEIQFLRRILEKHVPAIATGAVQIRGMAREVGTRSIVAVSASAPHSDPVGAVVGNRGCHIKAMVAELGEFIDVVRWSDSTDQFINNLLLPKIIQRISYDAPARRATITLQSHAPGSSRHEVNPNRLKLLSELAGWNLVLD